MKAAANTLRFVSMCVVMSVILPGSIAAAADGGLIAEGASVFSTVAGVGCKTCHGEYAEGDLGVGPFIRGATEASIRAAIDATNEMVVVRNAIDEDEIKAVAAYVGYLGTMQVARTLAKRGRFLPENFSTRPGTSIQVIIRNSGLSAHTFRSENMSIDALTIPARSTGSLEWQAPDVEGEFTVYCTDCKLKDQVFTIRVDANADEFRGSSPPTQTVAEDTM